MGNFTTKQSALFYCYTLNVEQVKKIDKLIELLEISSVSEIIQREISQQNTGRPSYDPYELFTCILYGFAMGFASLRDLEMSCQNDIRFMYIMNGSTPTYVSFGSFINKVIKPHADEIFSKITSAILKTCNLEIDDCYIDGTKIEALSNKYKVVWKPTRFHERLNEKVKNLLVTMGLDRGIPQDSLITSAQLAQKLSEAREQCERRENEERKKFEAMTKNLSLYLGKTLEYEEKENICGDFRNSYYKTDHDATAMCLKADYYSGLGSHMHAAYQIQTVVSHGLILSYFVSQDRTDIHTFIPTFETFYKLYGVYPKRICADAGYGCLENYLFCKKNNIKAFIKYQSWEGECSGRRPALYELNNDGTITCLGGKTGKVTEIAGRHHKIKEALFFLVEECQNCTFMTYCRQFMKEKTGTSKVFEINPEYQKLKQQARNLLLSPEGIEMRVNRSCQAEGNFGIVKYDMLFNRFRRKGKAQVNVEIMLTFLGFNLRKYMRYSQTGIKQKYWSAPENIEAEKFKKPSAKRLANRIAKRIEKPINQQVRDSYKYKNNKN